MWEEGWRVRTGEKLLFCQEVDILLALVTMEYFIQFCEYTYFRSTTQVLKRSMDFRTCAVNSMKVCFELSVCKAK